MHTLPKIFLKWTTAALYMAVLPVFFLAFSIVYDPFGIRDFLDMGRGLYTFNISILFAISLVVAGGLRSALQLFRKSAHFTWAHYISWCIGECLVLALFFSLFLSLMSGGEYPFFAVLFSYALPDTYLILIYPYLVLTLALALAAKKSEARTQAPPDAGRIRFYDMYRRPKLHISSSAVLYIKAEENYVSIWYLDAGRAVRYSLRASMNSLEENCARHGLVRCQRSYFVNPEHVTVLRRESGWIFADLDVEGAPSIPVSKRYYDKLSSLL